MILSPMPTPAIKLLDEYQSAYTLNEHRGKQNKMWKTFCLTNFLIYHRSRLTPVFNIHSNKFANFPKNSKWLIQGKPSSWPLAQVRRIILFATYVPRLPSALASFHLFPSPFLQFIFLFPCPLRSLRRHSKHGEQIFAKLQFLKGPLGADLIDRRNSGVSHPIFYLKNRKPNSPTYIERNYLQIYRPKSLSLNSGGLFF